jgi:hypothetical protein
MQYKPNIEQRLLHQRAKSRQLLSFYVKNFTNKGTTFFMDVLCYVVSDKCEGFNIELMALFSIKLLGMTCIILPGSLCDNFVKLTPEWETDTII